MHVPARRSFSRLCACAIVGALFASGMSFAAGPLNKTRKGLALEGYDPVSYFLDGSPTPGSSDFTHEWNGATWRFADARHRDLFADEPESYAPQYGGYCAKAMSEGAMADADPEAWRIVDGKLYLNYSRKVQKVWEKDIPGRIARADANWIRLLAKGE